MELGIIVAVSENGVIGKNGSLPWEKIPGDLPHFKKITMGKPVIMGRLTFESMIPYVPLRDRTNIVVTSQSLLRPEVYIARSLDDALKMAKEADFPQAWVIGGRKLYEEALPKADLMEMTRVKGNFDGDVYFPQVDWGQWVETKKEDYETHSFVSYRRR